MSAKTKWVLVSSSARKLSRVSWALGIGFDRLIAGNHFLLFVAAGYFVVLVFDEDDVLVDDDVVHGR